VISVCSDILVAPMRATGARFPSVLQRSKRRNGSSCASDPERGIRAIAERRARWHGDCSRCRPGSWSERGKVTMHMLMVIVGGILLLAVFCLFGRLWGADLVGSATAAKLFLPVWLAVSVINLWVGV